MSYTKHNFQSGAKLYASELNEMDEQIYKNESDINGLAEQIDRLEDQVGNSYVTVRSDNLINDDVTKWLQGNGTEVRSYAVATNFFEVVGGKTISCGCNQDACNTLGLSFIRVRWFAEDGTNITPDSYFNLTTDITHITVPDNAVSAICSLQTSGASLTPDMIDTQTLKLFIVDGFVTQYIWQPYYIEDSKNNIAILSEKVLALEEQVGTVNITVRSANLVNDDVTEWTKGNGIDVNSYAVATNRFDVVAGHDITVGYDTETFASLGLSFARVRWFAEDGINITPDNYVTNGITQLTVPTNAVSAVYSVQTGGSALSPSDIDSSALKLFAVDKYVTEYTWQPYYVTEKVYNYGTDDELDVESENTVKNKTVTKAINTIRLKDTVERFLFISDIHFGFTSAPLELQREIVEAILTEHELTPIKAIVINGDLLNNRYSDDGSEYFDYKKYAKSFVSTLKSYGFNVYITHGNHDCYTLEEWKSVFDNGMDFIAETEMYRYVFLNTWKLEYYKGDHNLDTCDATDISDDLYDTVEGVLDSRTKQNIIVCHYPYSAENFNALVDREDVICVMAGHVHAPTETTYREKPMFLSGSFSTLETGESNWTFRILENDCGTLSTYAVEPYMPSKSNVRVQRDSVVIKSNQLELYKMY